ncbi:hypothetical protein ABZT02_19570 [Streptomyces sp. NPDC005402]|uniref:hypothetical protein n=1 Tax=Streptomyces sp. NPDC005402 TaxID=3155338 RepID=UPI0033BBE319
MKALVLFDGAGTRSRPSRHTSAERPVPVADKAVLFRGPQPLADAGVTPVGMILGDTAAGVREALGDGSQGGLDCGLDEKPEQPWSDLPLAGAYLFAPAIQDVLRTVEPFWRGELVTTHTLRCQRVSRVAPALVGGHVEVTPARSVPRAHRLVRGDRTRCGSLFHGTGSGTDPRRDSSGTSADPDRVDPTRSEAFDGPAPHPAHSAPGRDRWTEVAPASYRVRRSALHEALPHIRKEISQ